jgi:large repetitive protein
MPRMTRVCRGIVAASLVGALVAVASPAAGYISTVSGQISRIAPPASVLPSGVSSPTQMFAFDEQQGATLSAPLKVDMTQPGTLSSNSQISAALIPAGTIVDSHYVDSARPAGGTSVREGTLTFSQDIVGVIVTRGKLDASDVLGAPQTNYGGAYPSRELELGEDWVQMVDQRTLFIHVNTTTVVDQVRIITRHNRPPLADAGGPYSATEGSAITLHGTASDPESDAITTSWSFSPSGPNGVSCTSTGTTTLTPTVKCNDDAVVTATLSVSDPYHPAVTSNATVTVSNAAPVITSLSLPTTPVPLGSTVNLTANFIDAGSNDTHTGTISWGDTNVSNPAINEGTGTASGSHPFTSPGIYTVTLTVKDDDLGTATQSGTVQVNGGPTDVHAGGPYTVDEGSTVQLSGSALDPETDPLSTTWTFTPTGAPDPGTSCTTSGENTPTPSISCNDNVVESARMTVSDNINPPVSDDTTVTVENVAPSINSLGVGSGSFIPGQTVTASGLFSDPGRNDTHVASINWGDATAVATGAVSESLGSGSATATHAYALPGNYTITLSVTDDDGATTTRSTSIHINARPTANAGGTYVGFEGTPATLHATAADDDLDPLTTSWSITWTSPTPGTNCTATGTNTLAPTITCDDDATVSATLTVSDGINQPVTDTATLVIGNVAPVVTSAVSVSPTLTPTNSNVTATVHFSDLGAHDTHTATIDWGDGNTSSGSVNEGTGTVSGTHAYAAANPYTIVITISDDDGGTVVATAAAPVTVNNPPTANAGGPYSGTEGTPIALSGSASDIDGDALTTLWSFTWTNSPAVTCTPTGANTLAPTITCDDNTTVTATLKVNDSTYPAVTSSVTISVANVAPVATGAVSVSGSLVAVGATVSVSVPFSDAGTHDTHSATIDWGDGNVTPALVGESGGTGTASGTHQYASPGSYWIGIKVTDDDGGSFVATAASQVVVNDPPTAAAGGPYSGPEGSAIALAGSGHDSDGDTLSPSWSFSWAGAPAVNCTTTDVNTFSPSVTCNDNTTVTATLTVSDGVTAPATSVAMITVTNVAPVLGAVSVSPTVAPVNTAVSASVPFSDAGQHDTHTATIDWGDSATTSGSVTESNGAGTASGSHLYTTPGVYTVSITVTDDDGASATATATSYVVVFDPAAGRVTGGVNFTSPSGAYTPGNSGDPNYVGPAHVGMNIEYHQGDTIPSGHTDFRFRAAGLDFNSTGYSWLVVTDGQTKAYFRGTGTVNDAGGYDFLVSVIDGSPDRIRIQVTDHATGAVLYDNQPGAPDDASATQAIDEGSIQIH